MNKCGLEIGPGLVASTCGRVVTPTSSLIQPAFIVPFEQTKIGETATQIIDPKADEIARTIHIGNVNASVRAKMISTVLKLA